jgi:predicted ATPase
MDIGVGVSQTLPVVVGAVEPNCTIFAVEQPELHIHPAVQVGLGDLFLREVLSEGSRSRKFLVETHSEHLVLRMMKRMRETCEGTLEGDFPEVTPEDVAILYVETVDGKTYVREMPLNERGELVKAWPGGFFEEALRETF